MSKAWIEAHEKIMEMTVDEFLDELKKHRTIIGASAGANIIETMVSELADQLSVGG